MRRRDLGFIIFDLFQAESRGACEDDLARGRPFNTACRALFDPLTQFVFVFVRCCDAAD